MSIQIVMMLPHDAASVSMARHTLAEALRIADVAPDCAYEAQVVLSEACTNVFHHAATTENFEVLIGIGNLDLTLHILDSGPGSPTNGHHHSHWPDHTAENGRGIALMNAYTDSASFDTQNSGGTVRLTKRLLRNAAAA
jgi:serine/threonine-protein kinase RsbW